MDPLDFVTLVDKTKAIVANNYTISRMIQEAKEIARALCSTTRPTSLGPPVV